jgi:SAM-dependent methyltransferase
MSFPCSGGANQEILDFEDLNTEENIKKYDIPEELFSFCDATDFQLIISCNHPPYWIAAGFQNLWTRITKGESEGLLKPGMSVVDLGSGSGSSGFIWAYKGYKVTGIELDAMLAKYSVERSNEFRVKFSGNAENGNIMMPNFLNDSYYPQEFIADRKIRSDSETQKTIRLLEYKYSRTCNDIFFPVSAERVDRKLLEKFDVWYNYAWDMQSPSVFNLFLDYAKDDAVLLLIAHERAATIREMYGRNIESHRSVLTKKDLI